MWQYYLLLSGSYTTGIQLRKEISFNKEDKKSRKKEHKKEENDKLWIKHKVLYDNLNFLNPDKRDLLVKDISSRTGLNVEKVEICKVDLVKGNAELDVSYRGKKTDPDVQ